jgi:hypothetical protein
MTDARVLPDGGCELVSSDEAVVSWTSPDEWADAWITEWLRDRRGPASEFVAVLTRTAAPGVVDVLTALARRAGGDPEILGWIGAGPLEDLVSHSGHGADVIDEVARVAHEDPALHRALAHVWLGDQVPEPARTRLTQLGARHLTTGVQPDDVRPR